MLESLLVEGDHYFIWVVYVIREVLEINRYGDAQLCCLEGQNVNDLLDRLDQIKLTV